MAMVSSHVLHPLRLQAVQFQPPTAAGCSATKYSELCGFRYCRRRRIVSTDGAVVPTNRAFSRCLLQHDQLLGVRGRAPITVSNAAMSQFTPPRVH